MGVWSSNRETQHILSANMNDKNHPRKVLYVSPTWLHGGAEEMLLIYMQAAQEGGFSPGLALPADGWLSDEARKLGIPIHCLPNLPNTAQPSKIRRVIRILPATLQLAQLIRAQGYRLVHYNHRSSLFYTAFAPRLAGIPAIVHIHDVTHLEQAGWLKAFLLETYADQVIAVSRFVQNRLTALSPRLARKTQVIYNGIPPSVYADVRLLDLRTMYHLPQNAVLIGSVSPINPIKGQEFLIRAFIALSQEYPDAYLFIIGSSQGIPAYQAYEHSLHDLAAQSGLQTRIIFTGWQDNPLDWIKSLDLFVHVPVQPDALPTVLLHALALGKPIIASDIGGVGEIIVGRKDCCLLEAGNLTQFITECMERLPTIIMKSCQNFLHTRN
jgi:glycosyltransferase involved in cell wall biosynthesis